MNMTHQASLPLLQALIALAAIALCSAAAAQDGQADDGEFPWAVDAPLPIDIFGGDANGVERTLDPIAIPRAHTTNKAAERHARIGQEIVDVLRLDLTISGLYRVLDESSFFFDFSGEGVTADSINFDNWSGVGAKTLIKSSYRVTEKNGEVRVGLDIRFFFISEQEAVELEWKPRDVPAAEVRTAVHDFVNALVKLHLGEWGPFGTRLAVTARAGGQKHIYTMDMDGLDVQRHTRNDSINILPSWGPNGSVYFTSYQDGNPNLYLLSNGKQRIISAKPGQNTGASHCGDKLAITLSIGGTNTDIYLIDDKSGRIVRRLTEHWGIDTSPSFSPDCKQIAFVSDRTGGPQIYVVDADGGDPRRLTRVGGYNTTPDWSPRGDVIVFTGLGGGRHDIFTVDLQGQVLRLTGGKGSNENPSFSPNGNYIAFTSTRDGGQPNVYIMTRDGFTQTRITKNGGYEAPAWKR